MEVPKLQDIRVRFFPVLLLVVFRSLIIRTIDVIVATGYDILAISLSTKSRSAQSYIIPLTFDEDIDNVNANYNKSSTS